MAQNYYDYMGNALNNPIMTTPEEVELSNQVKQMFGGNRNIAATINAYDSIRKKSPDMESQQIANGLKAFSPSMHTNFASAMQKYGLTADKVYDYISNAYIAQEPVQNETNQNLTQPQPQTQQQTVPVKQQTVPTPKPVPQPQVQPTPQPEPTQFDKNLAQQNTMMGMVNDSTRQPGQMYTGVINNTGRTGIYAPTRPQTFRMKMGGNINYLNYFN